MSESTSPYTLNLLSLSLSFSTKNKGLFMFQFSKMFLRKSLVITFKYILNSYTKYPTMIIYSHKLQSKWIWIEFILTFYAPSFPLHHHQKKQKET